MWTSTKKNDIWISWILVSCTFLVLIMTDSICSASRAIFEMHFDHSHSIYICYLTLLGDRAWNQCETMLPHFSKHVVRKYSSSENAKERTAAAMLTAVLEQWIRQNYSVLLANLIILNTYWSRPWGCKDFSAGWCGWMQSEHCSCSQSGHLPAQHWRSTSHHSVPGRHACPDGLAPWLSKQNNNSCWELKAAHLCTGIKSTSLLLATTSWKRHVFTNTS